MGTGVAPSQTLSEDSFKGQSSDAADARQGTSPGSGLSQTADVQAPSVRPSETDSDRASDKVPNRASDEAPDRAADRASDKASDRASNTASDKALDRPSDRTSDRASDRASVKVSGPQALSSAAAAQQTSDQPDFALPVPGPEDTAQVQQAVTDKVQQASMQAASPDAQQQPIPTKVFLSQHNDPEPPSQKSPTSGQAPPSLTGAQANGSAASVAAPQGSGLFKEPHSAPEAAASRDQQLQAAALEGTAASSQAAVNAGLSLPTPRSGTGQHHPPLQLWLGCMFSPNGVYCTVFSSCILL